MGVFFDKYNLIIVGIVFIIVGFALGRVSSDKWLTGPGEQKAKALDSASKLVESNQQEYRKLRNWAQALYNENQELRKLQRHAKEESPAAVVIPCPATETAQSIMDKATIKHFVEKIEDAEQYEGFAFDTAWADTKTQFADVNMPDEATPCAYSVQNLLGEALDEYYEEDVKRSWKRRGRRIQVFQEALGAMSDQEIDALSKGLSVK